jgi:rRNA maturation protein Rpf1
MIKERERIEKEIAMYLIIISSKKKNPNSLGERD